jgi:hypothetical protein
MKKRREGERCGKYSKMVGESEKPWEKLETL